MVPGCGLGPAMAEDSAADQNWDCRGYPHMPTLVGYFSLDGNHRTTVRWLSEPVILAVCGSQERRETGDRLVTSHYSLSTRV